MLAPTGFLGRIDAEFESTQVEHHDLMCYPNGMVRKLVECGTGGPTGGVEPLAGAAAGSGIHGGAVA